MAPSRRKGASKAAAAAAARRQWKVGDLVLAKVKGFPAWPATVSEPEKWGYSTDWKKVLVYFFGTQQIAFCNPADVEAFTEEKKQSLLVKRQGKGADFVRAVQEIVDSYEKLKKETQHDEANSGGNVADANITNPVNSSAKDQTDAPGLTHNLPLLSSNSVIDRHELVCAAKDDSAAVLKDESHNKAGSLEELTDNVDAVQLPKPVTYTSRKRSSGDLCPQGFVTDRHMPVRRSRTSSRVENSVLPCNDSGKSTGNQSTNAAQVASVRRNKHVRKSSDLSGCNDFDSCAFVSNGSLEDNDSEILTMDSDTFSLNEGSTIDSNFKHTETVECPEEVENKGLDLEIKGVVTKKKRKPNRKRATNDASKLTSRLEEELGVQNASQSSQNICGNPKDRIFEQDGDEHLPLVKRARVRMGKLSSTGAELNSIIQFQGKNCKEDINSPEQMITSSNCENGSSADADSSVLNGAMDNVSPSKIFAPCSEDQICNTKKDQTFCSVDGEAALPPSKRLHRALEAMSANAAVESHTHIQVPSSKMTSNGTGCISAVNICPCMAINSHEGDDLGPQKFDPCGGDSSHNSVFNLSTNSNPVISTENKLSKQVDNQLTRFQQQETGMDVLPGAADQVEELYDCVVCQTANADLKIQLHGQISPNHDSKCCEVGSNQDSPDPSLPPNDEDNITTVNNSNTTSDASEHNGTSLHAVADVKKNDVILPQINVHVPLNEVAACEDTKCLKPAVDDVNRANDKSEVVKEIKCKGSEEDMNYVSTSDHCLGEKGTLGIRSSPSLTDGGDCIPQGSPLNTSVCNVSTSDSSNILHNGSCSPDVHLHQKQTGPVDGSKDGSVSTQQSRSMGRSTEAGRAALLYFEAMLGTLTRTKESIGRATRIAIDCAKFGIAAKVMEILANNLESESSLHRRVDLFFLVDSIAQFSRGLKGDVCGVYPSAIQTVLPRLLSAAAPPGNAAQENRRQCLKVLRLWLERRILPESIIRHHIRELDVYSSASKGVFSRRSLRTERALDDPIREMEGMHVDEYGSNSSLQLPGFCMPQMLKDEDDNEGSDSDGGDFEAVTPEHNSEVHEMASTIEKHRHILEDVDGELEMEDVAPSCDVELNSFCNVERGNATEFEGCQRVFVYGLKLLWTIENRDAVWAWVGGLSKAFEPPKPSPSRQYAQRKLLEENKKHDGADLRQDDVSKCPPAGKISTSPSVQHPGSSGSLSSPPNSVKADNLSSAKKENTDDSDGTRHFMVNVIEPQFNLHSEDANGRFLLAAVSGRVLARSFHSVLHVGYEMIEQAFGATDVRISEYQPEMTWKRMEFSVMLEHVQAHVAPTDVDPGAGLQWLPKILRSSPKVMRTGALLERVFMPCDMYFRYTRHKGGTPELKVKPLKELTFNSHNITATMTSRQFQVMLDVLTNLLFARLPKPRKSSLSFPAEDDDDVEEEADEVVPDGVEEVELAKINLEKKEREQKLLLDDIRKLSLWCDPSGDLHPEKESDLWMITGGRSMLVQGLKRELVSAQKSRKAASVSLRMALQKAAQLRLTEKEKNKSPSYAMRISLQINKVVWSMLVDGKSFAEAEINDMIYDFDRDYKDVGVAQFTTKYFVVRNCLPNAKSDMLLSAWNPPSEWGKKVMLRVDAQQGAPRDGNSLLELFQVEIYPLKIHLTETMYRMMWEYFFPEEEQDSQRRQEVWKVSTTAGARRVKKGSSILEASASSNHSTKESETSSKSGISAMLFPTTSQPSVHVDSAQVSKVQNIKANSGTDITPELRRTSSFDRTWEETVAESVANELVLQSFSSSKNGSFCSTEQQDEASKNKSKDSKGVKGGRSSHEEKKVAKSHEEKRSRPRKMMEFHNIKISQVELLVTYEGQRFVVNDLKLLMDQFHRAEFTGTWRRLFSRVKKHIIWGVLKSVTGMQGGKFRDRGQSQPTGAGVPEIDLNFSDNEGQAGKSDQYPPSWPKRPGDGAGDGFVTSIRGLFNTQRRKAKAFVLRTMRGEAENDFQGDWSESDIEFSPFARQLTITKAKKLIRRHTKKFRSRGQKGSSSQQRESLPSSPRETTPFDSDSSSGSSPYEDFHE